MPHALCIFVRTPTSIRSVIPPHNAECETFASRLSANDLSRECSTDIICLTSVSELSREMFRKRGFCVELALARAQRLTVGAVRRIRRGPAPTLSSLPPWRLSPLSKATQSLAAIGEVHAHGRPRRVGFLSIYGVVNHFVFTIHAV